LFGEVFPAFFDQENKTMKLAIRIAALAVVVAGGVAAYCTPKSAPALPSHQAATATIPIGAWDPTAPPPPQ
jgi:hypothetical protein